MNEIESETEMLFGFKTSFRQKCANNYNQCNILAKIEEFSVYFELEQIQANSFSSMVN